jgi:hypothetical protein
MTTSIKITALTNIGGDIAYTTLIPVVNMSGTPTTQKANLQILGNLILEGAGGASFSAASSALVAGSVTNNAQANITSVGTLTSLTVSGTANVANLKVTGNVTSNLLPNANVTYDLGSSTQRWKDIWLANSTIHLGNATISGNGTSVLFSGTLQTDGNITATANSNVVITATNGNTSYNWKFDTRGNLTLPGNTWAVNYANGTQVPLGGGNTGNIGFTGNAIYNLGGVLVENADLTHGATATLSIPNNANTTTPLSLTNTYGDIALTTGTSPSALKTWNFDQNGDLDFPGGTFAGDDIEGTGNFGFEMPANVGFGILADLGNSEWRFNPDGGTIFPTLTVDLHNGGNQTAQTLQFGDTTQQAIITGPTPSANTNAQRLIIQGQRGDGTGEGGDVYLWAGDADNNGGDIKIYAGDADNVSAGYGGYINLEGGTGYNEGGYVNITAGQSTNSVGAYVRLAGGQGGTSGGNVNLEAGYGGVTGGHAFIKGGFGVAAGGAVSIVGGASATGLSDYGNVYIQAGSSEWTFDNAGNLSLPNGGSIFSIGSTPSGAPGNTIVLQPAGSGITTNQQLKVYPTAGDGDHIHMVTGNLYQTELFLGSDNLYVKLANTGNVVINSNDDNGNTAMWTFDTTGNLTLPGNLVINGYTDLFGSNVALLQSNPDVPLLTISTGANGTVSSVWLQDTGDIGNSNIAAVYTPESTSKSVRIINGNNGTSVNIWDFTPAGVSTNPILTVGTLPSPVTGMRAFVSDANLVPTGNFGATVGGGGANTTPVWSDGTNWYIG